jgi:ABC-type transporter Mla maintaining outer membrane lipid asymmetry ATPase subunit MlaF
VALTSAPVIRTSGLSKDYGQGRGLFDLDLGVERGEVLGFLGPNGAGKPTTMRLLLDLIAPTAAGFAVVGFLINGFAGHDPIENGVDLSDLAILAGASAGLIAIAVAGFQRGDLRG